MTSNKITKLIKDLNDHDASKRRQAAEELAYGDERALYPLVKALRDENTGVQDAAMRSLISIGGEVGAYMVLPLLREDSLLRNTALIILKEIGASTVPLLPLLLKDKDDDVRKFALDLIWEIRQCGYPEIIADMLMADPNANVRASAAKAIGTLQYREGLPGLIAALKDEEWVCFSVIEALITLGDERAVEHIARLLKNPSDILRHMAIEALGKFNSQASRDFLTSHLSDIGVNRENEEAIAAIKSLIEIGSTPSIPGVSDLLIEMFTEGDWDNKLIALRGLADLREGRAINQIVDTAGSLDPTEPDNEDKLFFIKESLKRLGCSMGIVKTLSEPSIGYRGKMIAIETAGDMQCRDAVPGLLELLKTNMRDIKRASIQSLGKMSEEGSTDVFIEAAHDEDSHVRKAALVALGRIRSKESFDTLLDILAEEKYSDVKEEAVKALIAVDSKAVFSLLKKFSDDIKEMAARYSGDIETLLKLSKDKNAGVRVSAISSLGKIQNEAGFKRLSDAMHDNNPEIRRAAIISAGQETERFYDDIKSALKDSDMWVRLYAVRSIGTSFRQDMLKILMPMLKDRDVPVVISAIEAISRIAGEELPAVLSPLCNHEDAMVREKVQEVTERTC
ncbi:MAG: HEAT repeat domain-containing protein [Nitrospirae bacterium]|nr:HEAT repeat domain-containing protein [Nitrospirota bacterium]